MSVLSSLTEQGRVSGRAVAQRGLINWMQFLLRRRVKPSEEGGLAPPYAGVRWGIPMFASVVSALLFADPRANSVYVYRLCISQ